MGVSSLGCEFASYLFFYLPVFFPLSLLCKKFFQSLSPPLFLYFPYGDVREGPRESLHVLHHGRDKKLQHVMRANREI